MADIQQAIFPYAFVQRKCFAFGQNVYEVCSQGSSDNGLVQAIIWFNQCWPRSWTHICFIKPQWSLTLLVPGLTLLFSSWRHNMETLLALLWEGIRRSPVVFTHKWSVMPLIWINRWTNSRVASDLGCNDVHVASLWCNSPYCSTKTLLKPHLLYFSSVEVIYTLQNKIPWSPWSAVIIGHVIWVGCNFITNFIS